MKKSLTIILFVTVLLVSACNLNIIRPDEVQQNYQAQYNPKFTDFGQYDEQNEIDAVIEKYRITVSFIDENSNPKQVLSEDEKEMMHKTLMYFTYSLDTRFKNTRIGDFLETLEICSPCSRLRSHNWGDTIRLWATSPKYDPYENDHYIGLSVHEIAHSLELLENIEEFRAICWLRSNGDEHEDNPNVNQSCDGDPKAAFIPEHITTAPFYPLPEYPSYYSRTDYKEDFAETVTAYALYPEEFRQLAEEYPILARKYNWVKENIFNGNEF